MVSTTTLGTGRDPGNPGTDPVTVVAPVPRAERTRAVLRQVVARIGSGLVVLWAAVTVTFLAVHLAPGDTISLLLGENRDDPELRRQIIERWGLDQPLAVQYVGYLLRVPRGDLGTSYVLRRPVTEVVGEQIGSTVELTAVAIVGAIAIAVVVSVLTSSRHRLLRGVSQVVELVLVSVPPFWIGILLLAVFSFSLGWFPVAGADDWRAVVLPAASLALPIGAYLTQVLRDGMERALDEPFAITARSRGISATQVRTRHALRHGSLPVVTLTGLIVGSLLGGAVIVEQVFGRPGLGQVAVAAVTAKDVPVILGVAIVATTAFVVVSTAVDLVYLLIDPRLRRQGGPATEGG